MKAKFSLCLIKHYSMKTGGWRHGWERRREKRREERREEERKGETEGRGEEERRGLGMMEKCGVDSSSSGHGPQEGSCEIYRSPTGGYEE